MRDRHNEPVNRVVDLHRSRTTPQKVNWLGKQFTINPQVFSPFDAPSGLATRALTGLVNFRGRSVWEVGCGAGLFTCAAAMFGAKKVTATDVSSAAIQNCKENVTSLSLLKKVSILQGSLFEPLTAGQQFDIVYADLPLADGDPKNDLERAFYDPQLTLLKQAAERMKYFVSGPTAEVYVCLSSLEDRQSVVKAFKLNGFSATHMLGIEVLEWITLELYCFCLQQ